jgi:excisionase family DNA binding protein
MTTNKHSIGDNLTTFGQTGEGRHPSEVLTTADVAVMLKKSRRTIEHWVRNGYLSSIKIGHSVFFEREQLLSDLRRFQVGRR